MFAIKSGDGYIVYKSRNILSLQDRLESILETAEWCNLRTDYEIVTL